MINRRGFTLAEVLITLGIIGVVASMTIPTLMNKVEDIQLKTAWKKDYSVLAQAHAQLIATNVLPVHSITNYETVLKPYLKVSKTCYTSTAGCWHKAGEMYTLSNVPVSYTGDGTVFVLTDGTMIKMPSGAWTPTAPRTLVSTAHGAGQMLVDVNGFKKPNRVGYDIFSVEIYGDGLFPSGGFNTHYDQGSYCRRGQPGASYSEGTGCSAAAIEGVAY